jgi:hypothetical protein
MREKINKGQKENKLIKHNGKYEFGHSPGWYQILRQHIIEMETWSFLGDRNMWNCLLQDHTKEAGDR